MLSRSVNAVSRSPSTIFFPGDVYGAFSSAGSCELCLPWRLSLLLVVLVGVDVVASSASPEGGSSALSDVCEVRGEVSFSVGEGGEEEGGVCSLG